MRTNFFLIVAFLCTFKVMSQCTEVYLDEYYLGVDDTTVLYSEPYDLYMDIYQGQGDLNEERPLIILAHGGTFVAGFRFNPTMTFLGEEFAKRGYVVASIDYRLMSVFDLFNYESAMDGVCEAIGDGRAAVRYFRKSIEEGNPYRIDPNRIFFGGNSAGGVIAMHIGLMQETDVQDPLMLSILEQNGGFEGDSGNDGYLSNVSGIISLAGAIHNTDFITEADFGLPIISCHTVNDGTVPYECGEALNLSTVPELCGAGAVKSRTDELSFTTHQHLDFDGYEHVPWEFFSESQDQMFNFVNNNLYNVVTCQEMNQTINLNEGWSIFSTYIDVSNLTMEAVMNTVVEEVYIVKNNEGVAYLPQWGYDGIGNFELGQGYFIKMNSSINLNIVGSMVESTFPILLNQGWNTVGYLLETSMSSTDVLANLVSNNNLIIAKDELGNAYLPEWNYNGMGEMQPGKGYQLKVAYASELVYN